MSMSYGLHHVKHRQISAPEKYRRVRLHHLLRLAATPFAWLVAAPMPKIA